MTHPISFRRHFLAVKNRVGQTFSKTAEHFAVGITSIERWNKQIAPKVYHLENRLPINHGKLAQDVPDHPNACKYERAARFSVTPKAT